MGGWGEDLLDFILPSGCVACGVWIRGGSSLACPRCRSRLREATWPRCPRCHHPRGTGRTDATDCIECRPWPSELRAARYAFALEPPATDLVHALKYEGWRELAAFMAAEMVGSAGIDAGRRARGEDPPDAGREPREADMVVPVPTTAERLARRGYNQAGLLAGHLARALGLPLVEALRRKGGGGSQTSLTPAERRENVRDVFATVDATPTVRDRDVLLVDDVLTTGATAGEAARTLVGSGARSVTLMVFARALPSRARKAA